MSLPILYNLVQSLVQANPAFPPRFVALPFVYQFAAGAIAGVTELLCLYPLGEHL